MQINATNAIPPILSPDRLAALGKPEVEPKRQEVTAPKVFTPAPPLRPNIQDYVDINRTLMALRKL